MLQEMKRWMQRKEFEAIFMPINSDGKQMHVVTKVKKLPYDIVGMAVRLAELDFIKYVRICDKSIMASSENNPNKPKEPIVVENHETAIGVHVLYDLSYRYVNFYAINSPSKGHGGRMVDVILEDFPRGWQPAVVQDWSNGFWDRMKVKHSHLDWM